MFLLPKLPTLYILVEILLQIVKIDKLMAKPGKCTDKIRIHTFILETPIAIKEKQIFQ